MLDLKYCTYLPTRIIATKGSSLGSCQVEALKIALDTWSNVELIHNDVTYRLNVNDLILVFKMEPDCKED